MIATSLLVVRSHLSMRTKKTSSLSWILPVAALAAGVAVAAPADAFCGFYVGGADQKLFNNATMVVLMREGTRTVLSMQNNYQGPPSDFAMVVPVPVVLQKENVKTLPREVFDHIDSLAAPRLVEYWEQDPCPQPRDEEKEMDMAPRAAAPAGAPAMQKSADDLGVRIEARFAVGEYEVLILSAQEASGLDTWLRQNRYKIPEGAEPVLRPYVAQGMKFFVAKVDSKKVKFENGQAMLSPLRFHYDSDSFALPVRLGLLNSGGTQDLLVHILSRGKRFEVANYPNVTIPTNYDVNENAREQFGAFYASLFDRTLEKHPGAVVTEYSWDAQSCDPCPTPPLDAADVTTLGADALTPELPPEPPTATPGSLTAVIRTGDVTSGNKIGNAAQTVANLQGSFQSCYAQQLARIANPKGDLKVSAKVAANGTVSEVKTTGGNTLPLDMVSCVVNAVRSARFSSPAGGKVASVDFPLTFDLTQGPPGTGWKPPRVRQQVNPYGFTLTRLHARYTKDTLGQDLVFREAPPIVGGREDFGQPTQAHGARVDSSNNFQGRYVIRHPWNGPIKCANPQRNVWGGPPPGVNVDATPKAASKIAFAPRGGVEVASFFRESVPELSIAAPENLPPISGTKGPLIVDPGSRGCGACTVGGDTGSVMFPASLVALAALLANERRRQRRK